VHGDMLFKQVLTLVAGLAGSSAGQEVFKRGEVGLRLLFKINISSVVTVGCSTSWSLDNCVLHARN
jgi:hypothetical protein